MALSAHGWVRTGYSPPQAILPISPVRGWRDVIIALAGSAHNGALCEHQRAASRAQILHCRPSAHHCGPRFFFHIGSDRRLSVLSEPLTPLGWRFRGLAGAPSALAELSVNGVSANWSGPGRGSTHMADVYSVLTDRVKRLSSLAHYASGYRQMCPRWMLPLDTLSRSRPRYDRGCPTLIRSIF